MLRRKKRLGAYLLFCSILLVCTPVGRLLTTPAGLSTIFFLETGKTLPPPQTQPSTTAPETEIPATTVPETIPTEAPTVPTEPPETEPPAPQQPVFSLLDADLVEVNNYCGYTADLPAFLTRPLTWQLRQDAPTVLILHSHGSESYASTASTDFRTQDTLENVVSVGDQLAIYLEAAGIRVLHDRRIHDYPSYSDAYENSRAAAREYLAQYPSIALILDLHRDAVADKDGDQVKYALQTSQGTAAQMMLVVGTDAGGLSHSKWPENMSLAVKLHAQLEKQTPGICRPISFRTQRFNQDLSTGALLVEMGSAGNSRQEALLSARLLADAIIALATGTE